jgi:hypothetical protein
MAKKVSPSNAVVSACISAADLFRVPCYREQSRVLAVVGAGGRNRPMFMGEWVDEFGVKHYKGKADLLMTPRISLRLLMGLEGVATIIAPNTRADLPPKEVTVAVPLWVECKSGEGRLEPEQKLFREHVLKAGNYYLEVHDSADQLIDWFCSHLVEVRR